MLINPTNNQKLAVSNDEIKNKNWVVINAPTLPEAVSQIKTVLKVANVDKIDNLVIRSHGSVGQLSLNLGEVSQVEDAGQKAITSNTILDFISAEGNKDVLMTSLNFTEQMYETHSSLQELGSLVKDKGVCVFTGCQSGADGGTLGKQLQSLWGGEGNNYKGKFYIALNKNQSLMYRVDENGKLHILDKPLQNNKKTDGFILITPNKDVIPLNNTLQINSSGNPITVVDEDNPDVIIKKENNPNDSSNGTTPDSIPIINE